MSEPQPAPRSSQSSRNPDVSLAAVETLRLGAAPPDEDKPKSEDRIPLLWRIFGGTVLSILALIGVTSYTQFTNALNDLRSSIGRLSEAQTELVQKDEFSSRLTSVWNSIKTLQESQATIASLKERSLVRDHQIKDIEERREAMIKEIQELEASVALLKDRAMTRDQKLNSETELLTSLQKEMQTLSGVVTGLKERALVQEQQAKYDEERKELMRELIKLRERVACMEGRTTAVSKPVPPEGN